MTVLVCMDWPFVGVPDGTVWTPRGCDNAYFAGYLEVFDQVRVLSFVARADAVPAGWVRADGPGVTFVPVPPPGSVSGYLLHLVRIVQTVERAVEPGQAVILRLDSFLSYHVFRIMQRERRPYAVEVGGDADLAYGPGTMRHPLRPLLRWWCARQQRRECRGAMAAAYVTERALQERYPCAGFSTCFTDARIDDESLAPAPRSERAVPEPLRLITVGSLARLWKGQDVLLEALGRIVATGRDARLVVVGEGRHREELEQRAALLGLGQRVRFVGHLRPGAAVRDQLDAADLFVLPSRAEGMPRAMLEAMARGLPCIGSTVNGIAELLSPGELVVPGSVEALARKILEVGTDPARLATLSATNLERARSFHQKGQRARAIEFYRFVHGRTAGWLAAASPGS